MRRTAGFALVIFVLSSFPFSTSSPQVPPLPTGPPTKNEPNPDIPSAARKELEKKANEQRQAELKRDTAKLVQLSTELKEYVDKTDENVLSLDVVKKAEEIEKLAHSVRSKMKGD